MSSNYGGFGGTRLPAAAVLSASELDSGHKSLLGLLETAVNAELGAAWRSVLRRVGDGSFLKQYAGQKPVGTVCDFEPTEQQRTQFKGKFPLLAVYREGEPELWYPNQYLHQKQTWAIDWILGPITADQIPQLGKFAIAVSRVICRTIEYARHPDFREDVCQFQGEFAHIKPVGVNGPGVQRALSEDAGSGYYGLTVMIETWEREYDTNDASAYGINANYMIGAEVDTLEGLEGADATLEIDPTEGD
jgi:hypothetical protein